MFCNIRFNTHSKCRCIYIIWTWTAKVIEDCDLLNAAVMVEDVQEHDWLKSWHTHTYRDSFLYSFPRQTSRSVESLLKDSRWILIFGTVLHNKIANQPKTLNKYNEKHSRFESTALFFCVDFAWLPMCLCGFSLSPPKQSKCMLVDELEVLNWTYAWMWVVAWLCVLA